MKQLKPTKQVLKALDGLDAKQYKQVASAILGLASNSEPHDSRSLKGAERGERRVDVGEYRIIYTASEDLVEVLIVGKRNDDEVYKMWERLQ
jgi:mRNA interferase RelE/StbE